MKLTWKKSELERSDQCFLLLGIWLFIGLLFAATFAPAFAVPRCHFKHFLGIPCGGCGTFRGLSLLAGFDLPAALRSQPLMMCLLLGFMVYGLASTIAHLLDKPMWRFSDWTRKDTRHALWLFGILFFANWMFLIADGR